MFLAFTSLVSGCEKCTWNSLNPTLPGDITSVKRVEWRRKRLAVRFIDRIQALCDKNLKLRESKFAILNRQIGSYKFTGFLIGCWHSSLPEHYMHIMQLHVEAHIVCMTVNVCLYVWLCVLLCRMCTCRYISAALTPPRASSHRCACLCLLLLLIWAGAFVHACGPALSVAHCIFPRWPWRKEMTFNMPNLLPQSILMLIYQTWSLPGHTTLPMFSGPWGVISGVKPSSDYCKGGNNTHMLPNVLRIFFI